MSTATTPAPSTMNIKDLEVFAENLDIPKAAAIYREHGALVVRGLMKKYVPQLQRDIEEAAKQAIELLPHAKFVPGIGWMTPDDTLFLPAPPGFSRDKQIMVLGVNYRNSAAFLHSSLDPVTIDLVAEVLGPNIELFIDGQCLYKEPVGGHPKLLHQDAAYFEHRFEGPMATLNYVVDTDLVNGALHVIPGSHKWGLLKHVDTFSHLGLDPSEWTFQKALPVIGKAGDAIFFHVKTVHGSMENHSKASRPVFINRYRAANDYVTVSAATTESRGNAEKLKEMAKKENQRGLLVRGFRHYDFGRETAV